MNRTGEVLANELVKRIIKARTWTEALHYRRQALLYNVVLEPATEYESLTPDEAYKCVDTLLSNSFWSNGTHVAYVLSGKVKGLPNKLGADLQDEGWYRLVHPQHELGLTFEQLTKVEHTGVATLKEIRNGYG